MSHACHLYTLLKNLESKNLCTMDVVCRSCFPLLHAIWSQTNQNSYKVDASNLNLCTLEFRLWIWIILDFIFIFRSEFMLQSVFVGEMTIGLLRWYEITMYVEKTIQLGCIWEKVLLGFWTLYTLSCYKLSKCMIDWYMEISFQTLMAPP